MRQAVAIIGAGISGLALGTFLAESGFSVSIFEKRPQLGTEGAGIQLTPNATHILQQLDVFEEIEARAHRVLSLAIHSGPSGRLLNKLHFDAVFQEKFEKPYLVLHRQDLVEVLANRALKSGAKLCFSKAFETLEKKDQTIRFRAGGEEYETDILIGADGVWSNVRPQISTIAATPTGRIANRALIDLTKGGKAALNDLAIWLGPHAHFVAYPVSQNTKINLVAIVERERDGEHWSKPTTREAVLDAFKDWSLEVQTLIEQADNWLSWPLCGVNPNHQWTQGNVALIGDAAHAMVPFLAQGGAAGLEDAVVLADSLMNMSKPDLALQSYEKKRKSRVIKIWQEALANGKRYHLPAPLAEARNLYLKAMPAERLLSRYDWIYGWRPPERLNIQPH